MQSHPRHVKRAAATATACVLIVVVALTLTALMLTQLVAQGVPLLQLWTLPKPAYSLAITPDGQGVAVGMKDGDIQLRAIRDGNTIRTLVGHRGNVDALAFNPDGSLLASASGNKDPTVRLWRVRDGMQLLALSGYSGTVSTLAYSPDGRLLASGGDDGQVRLWSAYDGTLVKTFPARQLFYLSGVVKPYVPSVITLAFSGDGRTLTCGDDEDGVRVWRVEDGNWNLVQTLEGPEREHTSNNVRSMSIGAGGKTVATAYEAIPDVYLWRSDTGQLIHTLVGHLTPLRALAFSPDGRLLAGANGQHVFTGEAPLLGDPDISIRIWELSTGRELAKLKGHTDNIGALAFSPDSKLLASGSDDNTVRLWQIK